MIHPTAVIACDELVLGEGSTIRAHAEIYGTRVVLGRESFVDEYAVIGGGSAGELTAGDWLHVGMFAQINTARPVHIGHEVGVGIGSRVFTHGAYLSEWDGFPVSFAEVSIGDRVWLPSAVVLPGVTIGSDVVVAAGSVVASDIESGSLAAGTPARVIRSGFPAPGPDERRAILARICNEADVQANVTPATVICAGTVFDIEHRTIKGPVSAETERLRNQLRRHGIRFRFTPADVYEAWT